MVDFKSKIREWKRVLQIARKPSKDEFLNSSKISALGIVIIGGIGFAIFAAFVLVGV
jgi:protein transport protein SEC61 subunit gamma-like protein